MITVVVLAFNEEKFLSKTIDIMMEAAAAAGQVALDIIIVNDGSKDATPQIIRQLEAQHSFVRSIHHVKNIGPGAGVKEAIAMARYPQFIVTPGDNDLPKELVTQLFLNKDKADLVLAYYLNMNERGWFRSGLSRLYTFFYQWTFNVPIHYINSPCLYPTDKLRRLNVRSDLFGYSAEMTIKLLCSGCTFYQIAGYRQKELSPSRSISWNNLREVAATFLDLVSEVKISGRKHFKYKPVEIF